MSKFNHEVVFPALEVRKTNFLSRIFGIFSEEIVGYWLNNKNCPYEGLGRPSIYNFEGTKLATLDFTLKDKTTGDVYIVEQKNFYGFKGGRLTTISDSEIFKAEYNKWSLTKAKENEAWNIFINKFNPEVHQVKVAKNNVEVAGRILIWSSYEEAGKEWMMKEYGLSGIISIDHIVNDLITWEDDSYREFVAARKEWTSDLFKSLV